MIGSFLHPEKGYKKGQEQLDKYYNQASSLYQPYINQGQDAYGNLSGAMQNLLNPADFQNQLLSSYEPSEAARLASTGARNSGLNAASSMGLMGSTPALQALQAGTQGIMANDQQNYLNNLLNQYFHGAEIAQNIYGTGAQAGQNMGANAMNMGQNSAQMAYGQQNAPGQMFNDLLKTAAYAYSNPLGNLGGASQWSTVGGGR